MAQRDAGKGTFASAAMPVAELAFCSELDATPTARVPELPSGVSSRPFWRISSSLPTVSTTCAGGGARCSAGRR